MKLKQNKRDRVNVLRHYFPILFTVLALLFSLFSCNNSNTEASSNKVGEDTMRMENHSIHTTANQEMKGMDMNDMYNSQIDFNDSLNMSSLVMSTSFRVISSQKSVKPTQSRNRNTIDAQGYISMDERRNIKVSARISGRIEKLYIKYNLQHVEKGDKIMDIYSPELNTYQEELLFLLKSKSEQSLIDKAEEKLRLLGITQTQINGIKKTGNSFLTMTVYSSQSGYVFFKSSSIDVNVSMNTVTSTTGNNKMGGSMGNNNTSNNIFSANGQIREGSYVNKGDVLFWINDLQQVWGVVAVDNNHVQKLKTGEAVSVVSELYKSDTIHTIINFVEPVYRQNQKFIMSRIYLKNTNYKYRINSLIVAKINTSMTPSLIVPYSSILFLGKRKIVWVLKGITNGNNKIYEIRDVRIGVIYDGMVEIVSGLTFEEEIAANAGYLIDRESLIKPE